MPPEYLALITLVIGLVFQPVKDGATALIQDRWANLGPDGRQAMVGSIFAEPMSWASSAWSTTSPRTRSTSDSTPPYRASSSRGPSR